MSFWENSACLPGSLRRETRKVPIKAVLITGRPIHFALLNESIGVGVIAKTVRKPNGPVME